MSIYVMCICFVPNGFLSTINKFGQHCTGNHVSVGSLDSGALSTESRGSTSYLEKAVDALGYGFSINIGQLID